MKTSSLCRIICPRLESACSDAPISGLFYDSRQVVPGGVFFALPGASADGHDFIDAALNRGARVIVMERERSLPAGVIGLVVENARRAMALAAAAFYGDPTRDMIVVGVTGTNGKTTITYLLEALLVAAGRHPAILGTVSYRFAGRELPSRHTTPESVDLMRTIAEFRDLGADSLVLEVSSHALEQHRADGVWFDVGVFTNLTPEHLDYHADMEAYFQAKLRLFSGLGDHSARRAVVNLDDPWGERLAQCLPEVLGCGTGPQAAVRAERHAISLQGIEAELSTPAGPLDLRSPLIGEYNLHNLLCAAGAGLALGIDPPVIAAGLAEARQVPGRLERIPNQRGALVLVDYAHTGDALENVLSTLRQLQPRRLLCVFGCGGDRDRSKRPVMGAVAGRLADVAVLTSDNPRSEEPLAIMAEVEAGLRQVHEHLWTRSEAERAVGRGYVAIADRREAIEFAVSLLETGDILLVAGKGHEDYQIVGSQRLHFDDREELRRALSGAAGAA